MGSAGQDWEGECGAKEGSFQISVDVFIMSLLPGISQICTPQGMQPAAKAVQEMNFNLAGKVQAAKQKAEAAARAGAQAAAPEALTAWQEKARQQATKDRLAAEERQKQKQKEVTEAVAAEEEVVRTKSTISSTKKVTPPPLAEGVPRSPAELPRLASVLAQLVDASLARKNAGFFRKSVRLEDFNQFVHYRLDHFLLFYHQHLNRPISCH